MKTRLLTPIFLLFTLFYCREVPNKNGEAGVIKIIQLDPTHSHAAAAQNEQLSGIDSNVYVYSPDSSLLTEYFNQIKIFNTRTNHPTRWNEKVYSGKDYLEKMVREKQGNVVVLSGNNRLKIDYIEQSVNAGLNVFSDKPMVINKAGFERLKRSYAIAEKNGVLLFDMMTERYNLLHRVQRFLMQDTLLFGRITQGTATHPAIMESSVHHYYRGGKGTRPDWFFDVLEQGEGIVDVTTHLIDLTFWKAFPDEPIDYQNEIKVLSAKHWPVTLTQKEFSIATSLPEIPASLNKYMKDSLLTVFANGSITYDVKGVNIEVDVEWRAATPPNGNDIRSAYAEGTRAKLVINQNYGEKQPKLYIQKRGKVTENDFRANLAQTVARLHSIFPGLSISKQSENTEIIIPSTPEISRDPTFKVFTGYLVNRNLPKWEIPNTLAKYYITTTALEMAKGKKQ